MTRLNAWRAGALAMLLSLPLSVKPASAETTAPVGLGAEAAPLRVALLGTSLTSRGGWDEALAARLSECLGRPVEALNFGGAGENSRWGLAQVGRVRDARPDVVAVEFSANDASLLRGLWLDESVANVEAILTRLSEGEGAPKVALLAMNPMRGMRGWIRPWLDDYYDAYRPLAARTGAAFLDLRPHWRALGGKTLRRAIPDGLHPTPQVSAKVIAPPLAEVISHAVGAADCARE